MRQNNRIILGLIDDKGTHLICLAVFHSYELRGITIRPKTSRIHCTTSIVVSLTVSNLSQNLLNFLVLTFDYFILLENSFVNGTFILAQATTDGDTEDNENQKDDDDSHQKQKVFTVVQKLCHTPFLC